MAIAWQTPDSRLVDRVRHGDGDAFEEVYRRHSAAVLAFCTHLTGQREDAEDALQHTFLAAYRQMVGSREPLELRPWLFTVARNRCLAQLRSHRSQSRLPFDPTGRRPAVEPDGLVAEVERREDLRHLLSDLQTLPEAQRTALVLSQLDAMPYREIGQVLAVAPEKVKALVFQARSSLASTREAREAPCTDIRVELATARGASLRRRSLRRHVRQCSGCRAYEVVVRRQRQDLTQLLPVPTSVGLTTSVLGAIGREGATGAGGAGGAGGVVVAGSGGPVGGSFASSLAAVGGSGIAKVAVVAVIAGGGVAAVATELPARLDLGQGKTAPAADRGLRSDPAPGRVAAEPGDVPPSQRRASERRAATAPAGDSKDEPLAKGTDRASYPRPDERRRGGEPHEGLAASGAGSPSGSEKHGGLPPGQAKKPARQGTGPPGQGGPKGKGQAKAEGLPEGKGPVKAKTPAAPVDAPTPSTGAGTGNGQAKGDGNGQANGNGNGKKS